MPAEGFGSIDLKPDFTDHILTVLFGDTAGGGLKRQAVRQCAMAGEIHSGWPTVGRGVTGPVGE